MAIASYLKNMKTFTLFAVFVTTVAAHAVSIINPQRSISASGTLTPDIFSPLPQVSSASTGTGSWNQNVQTGGNFIDDSSYVRGSVALIAQQSSAITDGHLDFDSAVSAEYFLHASQVSSIADSWLNLDLILTEPHEFSISANHAVSNPIGLGYAVVSLDGYFNFINGSTGNATDSTSGVLPVGNYHLSILLHHESSLDALSDSPRDSSFFESLDVAFSLEPSAQSGSSSAGTLFVSDYGSTALLLLLPLGLGLMLQKRSASSRVTSSR